MSWRRRGNNGLVPDGEIIPPMAPEKPHLEIPVTTPLTNDETDSATQFISLRSVMKEGPFFTGSLNLNETSNVLGDGIQRYSDKYNKVTKIGRTIEEHPYQLAFFPEELYSVMGVSKREKKQLKLSSFKADGGLRQLHTNENGEESLLLQHLKDIADDLDNGPNEPTNEEENEEEDEDDEFEEDDDDDYNAEKYFDDGGEEFDDDDDDEPQF